MVAKEDDYTVAGSAYEAAVDGRREFRDAYMRELGRANGLEVAVREALKQLSFATPAQRNGPCIKAIDCLRGVLGLEPMAVPGGKATDGLARHQAGREEG